MRRVTSVYEKEIYLKGKKKDIYLKGKKKEIYLKGKKKEIYLKGKGTIHSIFVKICCASKHMQNLFQNSLAYPPELTHFWRYFGADGRENTKRKCANSGG